MSNELRVRRNFLSGVVDDNPLSSTATTLTSSALATMVAIGTTQHLAITLDPDGTAGNPEIAYITAHTASAGTATILRGQEGTSARSHNQNTPWLHGPTARDMPGSGAKATLSTSTTVASTTDTSIPWGSHEYDTDGYHSTSSNTDRLTVPVSGLYMVGYDITPGAGLSNSARFLSTVKKNGSNVTGTRVEQDYANVRSGNAYPGVAAASPVLCAAGDYLTCVVHQQSGGTMTLDTGLCAFWVHRIG